MSCTTLKALWPGKKSEDYKEFGNSHGSAPVVWEAVAGRYLGVTKSYDYPQKGWMQLGDELWSLWKRTDIPEPIRAVFMLTFDRAYVLRKDYTRMAKDIHFFLAEFPAKSGVENHWSSIAYWFEQSPKFPAMGLYCTSVSEDPFEAPWDEVKGKPGKFDWSTAYDLYEHLDSLKVEHANQAS